MSESPDDSFASAFGETAVASAVDYADDPPEWLRVAVEEAVEAAELDGDDLQPWVPSGEFASSALVRLPRFPSSIDGEEIRDLELSAVRNEQQSAQLAVTTSDRVSDLSCSVGDLSGENGRIPAEHVTTRFVGYVPVQRTLSEMTWSATLEGVAGDSVSGTRRPDVVGDPLLERSTVDVPPFQTQPIWVTVDVPADLEPGAYSGQLTVTAASAEDTTFDLEVTVREPVLPDPESFEFHLDAWMSPDGIAREHGVDTWSEDHWRLLEAYFEELANGSQAAVTTTLVDDPWIVDWLEGSRRPTTEHGYSSMVEWTYDGSEWSFDFSVFDRYVETARSRGVGPRIHAFGFLGFRPPERLAYYHAIEGERVEETVDVGGDRWRAAWTAFFDAFVTHLDERDWLDDVWLAIDERDEEVLRAAVEFLDDVAPRFADRLSIAGSREADSYADDLSVNTLYVPGVPYEYEKSAIDEGDLSATADDYESLGPEAVDERRAEGQTTTFYAAGTPSHPNRLAFSPAVESRLLPWIAAEERYDGFLCWSFTSWPADVYADPTFQYVQGDEYLVYPGPDGPLSSIRWELLREGIEDYELVRAAGTEAFAGTDERLREAIAVATAELDGRSADVTDLARARSAVVDILAESD